MSIQTSRVTKIVSIAVLTAVTTISFAGSMGTTDKDTMGHDKDMMETKKMEKMGMPEKKDDMMMDKKASMDAHEKAMDSTDMMGKKKDDMMNKDKM